MRCINFLLYLQLQRFSIFFSRHFQSRLLHICCMWERFKWKKPFPILIIIFRQNVFHLKYIWNKRECILYDKMTEPIRYLIGQCIGNEALTLLILLYLQPFPTYNKSTADDFENIVTKTLKISIKESLMVIKSCKHCGQIAHHEQFHLLSQCFQKSSVAEVSESVGKGQPFS